MKKVLTGIFLLVATVFLLSIGNVALAQEAPQGLGTEEFVVAPHRKGNESERSWLLYTARPGDTIRDSIDVWNRTEEMITFSIRGIDATLTNDDGFALRNDDDPQYYLGKWISLSETKITINPKQHKEIPVIIRVPSESTEMDYWGGITVTTARTSSESEIKNVGWRVGIRTLVRVSNSVDGLKFLPQANEGGSYDFVSALKPFRTEYEQKDPEMRAQMQPPREGNQTAENTQANILENEQGGSYMVFLIVAAVFVGLFLLGAFGGKKVRIERKPPVSLLLFLTGIFGVSTFFLNPSVSSAQQEGGLSILPYMLNEAGEDINQSWFILRLAPGEEKPLQVKVRNLFDQPTKAWLYAVDSTVTTDGGFALQPEEYEDKDVGAWITLAQSEMELAPQEMKIIDLTIRVPETVEMGDHAGGLLIQSITEKTKLESTGFHIVARTGLRVYVNIPGEQVFKLTSSSLKFDKIGTAENRGFLLALANNGNVRIVPLITVEIRNLFGKVVDTVEYNVAELLPGKSAELRIPWENLKAGWYKAKVYIQYGQGQSSTEEISFAIAPQGKALIYLGVGLAGVILLIIFLKMFFSRFTVTLTAPKKKA